MKEEQFVKEAIELFDNHKHSFVLCDHDFPDDTNIANQEDFEEKFSELICKHKGHDWFVSMEDGKRGRTCYRCLEFEADKGRK